MTGTYLAKDTCGANMACQHQACVKPGKYKPKRAPPSTAAPAPTPAPARPKTNSSAAEAEFEFPATATIKLLLKR